MTIENQLAEILSRIARIEQHLGTEGAAPDPATPPDVEEPETWGQDTGAGWVEPHIAAARLGLTQDAIRKWCRQGYGRKTGGRWKVDLDGIREARAIV